MAPRDALAEAEAGPPSLPSRHLFFRVFPSIMLPMFLASVDGTIVAAALPTIAAEMGEVERGSLHYSTLFALGIVLFVITFLINSLASWLVGGQRPSRRREF